MKFRALSIALITAGLVAACEDAGRQKTTQPASPAQRQVAEMSLNQIEEKYTREFLRQLPSLSTMLAISEEQAGGSYNDKLPDYSSDGMKNLQASMTEAAAALNNINAGALTASDLKHRQILSNIFAYYAGDEQFPAGYIDTWAGHLPYIINQMTGPLIDVPKMMQAQQVVRSEQEARDYLTRLANMDHLVDEVVAKFRADAEQGIVLPEKLHPKTLAYLNGFLAVEPAEHGLVTSFAEKLGKVDALSEKNINALVKEATVLVSNVVYPAFNRARDAVLESEKQARNSDGIWSQPGGESFYIHQIEKLADSSLSPDEIHQLGLDEVARISALMDEILVANGFHDGTVGERMLKLATLPGQRFEATDEGRQALLSYLNDEVKVVMAKAPAFYGTIPTQRVEIERIPPVSEAGEAGGFYSQPSLDGSRPGVYWINLRDMEAVPKFSLKTLTYHEAVPGHHFQMALNMAQTDIGLMRQNAPYNAFVEGWALYSEYVAATYMDMYEDDPLGDLGRLQAELYRAVRLVVDTGIHKKHWTREQAIDYFFSVTGTSLSEVEPEVERYIALPGQALGYKLGMMTFVALEKQARESLGAQFDIRTFHDVILLPGARPMAMVRKDVENWIAAELSE